MDQYESESISDLYANSIEINGELKGEISGADNVIVSSTGQCNSNIKAKRLEIYGVVEGNIEVNLLIIQPTGKLSYGNISYKELINNGGLMKHILFHDSCNYLTLIDNCYVSDKVEDALSTNEGTVNTEVYTELEVKEFEKVLCKTKEGSYENRPQQKLEMANEEHLDNIKGNDQVAIRKSNSFLFETDKLNKDKKNIRFYTSF